MKSSQKRSRIVTVHSSFVLLLFFMVAAFGCSPSLIKMNPDEQLQMRNLPEISAIHDGSASLSVMTPGKSVGLLFGAIGGAITGALAASEGKEMMATLSLSDPAGRVKEQFVADLREADQMTNLHLVEEALFSDDLGKLKERHHGPLFFFKTTRWALNSGQIHYAVVGRLVRLEDDKVLWQGVCNHTDQDTESKSMDELTANNGALLKAKIDTAVHPCAKELVSQFLDRGV